jgi:hypothetical protein
MQLYIYIIIFIWNLGIEKKRSVVGVKDVAINNSAGQKTHRDSIFHVISHFFPSLLQPFSDHFIGSIPLALDSCLWNRPQTQKTSSAANGEIQRNNWCMMLRMISCDPFPISFLLY